MTSRGSNLMSKRIHHSISGGSSVRQLRLGFLNRSFHAEILENRLRIRWTFNWSLDRDLNLSINQKFPLIKIRFDQSEFVEEWKNPSKKLNSALSPGGGDATQIALHDLRRGEKNDAETSLFMHRLLRWYRRRQLIFKILSWWRQSTRAPGGREPSLDDSMKLHCGAGDRLQEFRRMMIVHNSLRHY